MMTPSERDADNKFCWMMEKLGAALRQDDIKLISQLLSEYFSNRALVADKEFDLEKGAYFSRLSACALVLGEIAKQS